ncbi:MAG: hypothetical protein LW817_07050 [Candidatus Caenarcaniphilales bacterium]|jgi:hypothetical protein|nr:hypothetical protein [Candidatus Caenarcaniphilales bacterium]
MSTGIQSNNRGLKERYMIPFGLTVAAVLGLSSSSIREAGSKKLNGAVTETRQFWNEMSTNSRENALETALQRVEENSKRLNEATKDYIGEIFDEIKDSKEKQEWVKSQGYEFDTEKREEFIKSHQVPHMGEVINADHPYARDQEVISLMQENPVYDASPEIKKIAALNLAFDRDLELMNNPEKKSKTLDFIDKNISNSADTIYEGYETFLNDIKTHLKANKSVLDLLTSPKLVQRFLDVSAKENHGSEDN